LKLTSILACAAFAVAALGGVAQAKVHSDGNGGAVCKGAGSCLVLELDCKGTYTDATQTDGTVYGKCDKVKSVKRPGTTTLTR
jgi:hypothetical protein